MSSLPVTTAVSSISHATTANQLAVIEPLKVVIVGAGIGGLTAALALRQQGHQVDLFESSRFSKELGAALHIAPNGNGILKRLGLSAADTGANLCNYVTEYSSSGEKIAEVDLRPSSSLWQHEWLLAHRVKLHDALRTAATAETGIGRPAKLHLSHPVVDLDVANATVRFADGSCATGDVIIGADGVHSVTRSRVPGADKPPFGSGRSAFRFMIPKKLVAENPITRKFVEKDSDMVGIAGRDRAIVIYPTSNNEVLNCACLHPSSESTTTEGWGSNVSKEMLLHTYRGFDPSVVEFLKMAEAESLKAWQLLDMDTIPQWTNDRLALLGDAAHPFLPYQGQGASCAIEDAAALGVVLERGLTREEVPSRLKLYQDIRKARADKLQDMSRGKKAYSSNKKTFHISADFNFGHDEFDYSTQKLREWKWSQSKSKNWIMPTVFGPIPAPYQQKIGSAQNGPDTTFTTASIKIRTSRTVLQNLLPQRGSWSFISPGTIAYCTFTTTKIQHPDRLRGLDHSTLALYFHGVEHKEGEKVTRGSFLPVLFDSSPDFMTAERESFSLPAVFSSIDLKQDDTSCSIHASSNGFAWSNFRLDGLKLAAQQSENEKPSESTSIISDSSEEEANNVLVQNPTSPMGSISLERSQTAGLGLLRPTMDSVQAATTKVWRAEGATFGFNPGDWNSLPTLHHIISRLGEIPVYSVVEARIEQSSRSATI